MQSHSQTAEPSIDSALIWQNAVAYTPVLRDRLFRYRLMDCTLVSFPAGMPAQSNMRSADCAISLLAKPQQPNGQIDRYFLHKKY